MFSTYARVDPLTSILAAMARSWQILTTSWQPWIPWQNSHKDLTKKYLSRPAPGRDFTCCGGIPQFTRGKGHGRATQH